MAPWAKGVLWVALALLALDLAGGRVLTGLGVTEALMASSVPLEMGLLPLALAMLSIRLLLYVVAPGLVVAAILLGRRRGR
jgi:hypothetical protein